MVCALLALLLLQATPADVKRAQEKLAESPDDPAANTTVGRFLCLAQDDFEKGLPLLVKGNDKVLADLATKDIAAPANALERVDLGDSWSKLLSKYPKQRQALIDRASFHYAVAWPDLDAVWRGKLRDKLSKLYAVQGPVGALKEMGFGTAGKSKIAPASENAHSGSASLKIAVGDEAGLREVGGSQSIELKPGDVELSFWVWTDGTDTIDDGIAIMISDGDGKEVGRFVGTPKKDTPIWIRYHKVMTLPAGTVKCKVALFLASHKGTIRIDDISIKQGGKELTPWGNFESK